MNDCMNAEVRDALPDLLHGRLGALDTATMNAHVESCADCRAELELMREARSSTRMAPPIDVARIAAAIPPYGAVKVVPTQPRDSIFERIGVLRIAIAAAFIAVGGWALSGGMQNNPTVVRQSASTAVTPGVSGPGGAPNSKSTESVISPAAAETQVADLSLVGSTADLSDSDLEQLVAELDGIETLPSEEPQTITITDAEIGTSNDTTNP